MSDEAAPVLTSSAPPSLLRSGMLSLVTSAAPLVVALVALPLLARHLGIERLGLLALAWAWLGYAALLDFGLGRALTRMVAASDAGETLEAPIGAFVSTAHRLLTVVGSVVGVIGVSLAPWYVDRLLHVSVELQRDALMSAIVFSMTVPAVTGASVPRAVLEARQQFRDVNLVRLPVSVGSFAVPLLLLPFTASLTVVAMTLAVLRVWAWWRYSRLARAAMPPRPHDAPRLAYLPPLMRAGAWMTISNVLSPLMTVADRFLIASVVSVSAVALYAVPWEAIMKLGIVPGALTMVLFPAITRASAMETSRLIPLHAAGVRLLTIVVTPICALAALLAPWLIQFAGGAQYAGVSVTVLRILSVGVAANCIAAVPYTLLQASGRARWTATLHLFEIVPFVTLLWFAVHQWGIVGAAVAWTTRVVIDAALMAWRAQSVAPLPRSLLLINGAGVSLVILCAWLGASGRAGHRATLILAIVVLTLTPLVLWMRRSEVERRVLGEASGRR